MGWASHTGMGYAPLSFAEIEAWARLTQTRVLPWEALALRQASAAYVGQLHAGDGGAPFTGTTAPRRRSAGSFAAQARAINAGKRGKAP